MVAAKEPRQLVAGVVLASGLLSILAGLGVLALQIVLWLKDGFWTPAELRVVWELVGGSEPAFAWLGVQRIALGILGFPLALGLFLIGLFVMWLSGVVSGPYVHGQGRASGR